VYWDYASLHQHSAHYSSGKVRSVKVLPRELGRLAGLTRAAAAGKGVILDTYDEVRAHCSCETGKPAM